MQIPLLWFVLTHTDLVVAICTSVANQLTTHLDCISASHLVFNFNIIAVHNDHMTFQFFYGIFTICFFLFMETLN